MYLKKIFLLAILTSTYANAQEFQFPENRLGHFANTWFNYVNSGDSAIYSYDSSGEWVDFLGGMRQIAVKNEGIIPLMLSYQTDNDIAIYSKERSGGFVTVIIGLTGFNEISQLSIKKSFAPNYYENYLNLTNEQLYHVVENIAVNLDTGYVRDSLGAKYSDFLRSELALGSYDALEQADLLAKRITQVLQDFTGDKHLELISPTQMKAVKDRFGAALDIEVKFIDVENAVSNFRFINSFEEKSVSMELAPGPEPELRLDAPSEEVSVQPIKSKMLENKIGLVTLERFVGDEEGIRQIRSAFEAVKSSETLVIDLRQSGGGDGTAADEILGYLLNRNSIFSETFNSTELFLLTGSGTISAGESVAYQIKESKRGTIIGERTAGAGYRVDVFEVGYGFYFVNSIASSFDESRGEGWQGIGIQPDVEVESSKALEYVLERISTK